MSKHDELVGGAYLAGWNACRERLSETLSETLDPEVWGRVSTRALKTRIVKALASIELPVDPDKPPVIPAPGADPGWAAFVLASIVDWKPEGGFPFEQDACGESDDLPDNDTPFGTESYLYALFGKDDARSLLARLRLLARALGFDDLRDKRFRAVRDAMTCVYCAGPVGKPCRQAPEHHPHAECNPD